MCAFKAWKSARLLPKTCCCAGLCWPTALTKLSFFYHKLCALLEARLSKMILPKSVHLVFRKRLGSAQHHVTLHKALTLMAYLGMFVLNFFSSFNCKSVETEVNNARTVLKSFANFALPSCGRIRLGNSRQAERSALLQKVLSKVT